MATITLTVSAGDLARAVDALGTRWGYLAVLADGSPNPQSKGEFVRLQIAKWIKSEVHQHELATAQAAVTVSDVVIT